MDDHPRYRNYDRSRQKVTASDMPLIVELLKTHTLHEIGLRYGVTRERIRQRLAKLGVKPKRVKRQFIVSCATPKCPQKVILKARITKRKTTPQFCTACQVYASNHRRHPKIGTARRQFEMGLCERCGTKRMIGGGICGSCRTHKWYHAHPEYRAKIVESSKRWQQANPNWFKEYYQKNKEYIDERRKQAELAKKLT